jgi:glycosyltransferase involved in cell wall biosynthesis
MYDYVIVTHIPVFYKVNLYNEMAKKLNIFVIFVSDNTNENRSSDFIKTKDIEFKYLILSEGNFQSRGQLKNIQKLRKIINDLEYKRLLVSGWDLIEFWFLVLTKYKKRNCMTLESTVMESSTKGLKGLLKKIFLSRVSVVFASGDLHKDLLLELNYTGQINITKGVGIINKPICTQNITEYQKRFIFVGRLSKVKNLEILITIFNKLKDYKLTIIGTGEDEQYLKNISNENIIFKGSIKNEEIKNMYKENDVLILPSVSETWGLVVEEALYFGLPVIVSQNCGAVELVENERNGYIIKPDDIKNIKNVILKINADGYIQLVKEVNKFSISEKDNIQINSYL